MAATDNTNFGPPPVATAIESQHGLSVGWAAWFTVLYQRMVRLVDAILGASNLTHAGAIPKVSTTPGTLIESAITEVSGDVGIGTAAPVTTLHVDAGARDYTLGLQVETTSTITAATDVLPVVEFGNNVNLLNGGLGLRFSSKTGTGILNTLAQVSAIIEQVSAGSFNKGGLQFSTTDGTAWVDVMRISGAGNVGIKNTAPAYPLDVTGDVNVTGVVRVGGTQVLGARQPAITAPSGGTVIDVQARAAIATLISELHNHGLIG